MAFERFDLNMVTKPNEWSFLFYHLLFRFLEHNSSTA
jgi:hypothetical protein